ncbi:MAG: DUF2911 domain-containing protein [Vicinamibacterales bacterium]
MSTRALRLITMAAAGLMTIAPVSARELTSPAPTATQQTVQIHAGRGGSPHVRTTWAVDGATISIEYGRPYLKGRPEATLMPAGQPWRVGADEATTLVSDKPLKFGSLTVPAGTHTLYTVPGASGWQLIVSRKTGQWGIPYPGEADDLGRVPMTVGKTSGPVEQLTLSIEDTPAGGTLHVEWGTTRASVAFTVQ